ncbi:beta-mannosidase [Mycolicibacterium porcinum]|uniref:cellulase family glycosylhydrolase n=1 Tax=Mycolicibacterium porcinum TaxID=39693 RepID=UPI00080B2B47|nr:cellulase family glycosylhydrolase [Mycolicibacterium porcinum]OCB15436.1 beta-mannosidase [Mycolicibacterium porcinum]
MALLVATACSPSPPLSPPSLTSTAGQPTSGRAAIPPLGVSGMSLTLGGKPQWPTGINAYQLATNWSVNAGCGAQVDLDSYFGSLPPHSLTRFNAYSSFAVNKFTGQLDFTSLDAVFRAAERHGQLLIAVLTSDEGGCENEYFKNFAWYADGWRTEVSHGLPMSFAAWLDLAVKRWANSPALAGWTAVGEPEPTDCRDHHCHWTTRYCPPNAADVLRAFFDATGARIRELDPGAVIFSGHAGGGQCGSAGDEYAKVNSSPGVDVLEYHYYEETDFLPGDEYDGVRRRVEQARSLGKPLLIAEIGMEAGSCGSLGQRKQVLTDALDHMRTMGAAGAMFWAFVPDPRPGECTLDIGPTDPLWSLIGATPA